jgi:ribosomal protein S18 acetylase RimI-like enzyme
LCVLVESKIIRTGKGVVVDQGGYTIRRAVPADSAALAQVHDATWRETYVGLMSGEMLDALTADARTEAWERMLSGRGDFLATTYVAERSGMLVAFGSCGEQRNEAFREAEYGGEIAAVYVLKADQRQGLGTRLMHTMMTDLRDRGLTAFTLWMPRDNIPARSLYESLGGRLIGQRTLTREQGALVEVAYGWRPG